MMAKVSMVISCYNKRDYIDAFFESVLAQVWDDMEIILINNGSTDGTELRVRDAVSRLRARGYEVAFLDLGENIGLTGAVKEGLLRVTGKYVCIVDCDDELHPEYVSKMAGFLEENGEYDWAVCGLEYINSRSVYRESVSPASPPMLENFLFDKYFRGVWRFLIRMEYLKKCEVIEYYQLEPRICHEPQILLPLIAGGGKLGHIDEPLYRHNEDAGGVSKSRTFEDSERFQDQFLVLAKAQLERLFSDSKEKSRLIDLAKLRRSHRLLYDALTMPGGKGREGVFAGEISVLLERLFGVSATAEEIMSAPDSALSSLIEAMVFGRSFDESDMRKIDGFRRVIGYGALGKMANSRVPRLMGSRFEPRKLWDKGAEENSELCGIPVTKPDFSSLSESDILIVFPKNEAVVSEVRREIANAKCGVLYHEDIDRLWPLFFLPQLFFRRNQNGN